MTFRVAPLPACQLSGFELAVPVNLLQAKLNALELDRPLWDGPRSRSENSSGRAVERYLPVPCRDKGALYTVRRINYFRVREAQHREARLGRLKNCFRS